MDTIIELLHELNGWSAAFRILLAVLLGGFVGLERGLHGRNAGLRTHILVCLGSALTVMVGLYSVRILNIASDPLRVGAQVISGIGFLGVGTIIIRNRANVSGLTTAAGLWATACMGLSIGIGFYAAAIATFVAIMITISIFVYLDKRIKNKSSLGCYVELKDIHAVNDIHGAVEALVSEFELMPPKSGFPAHVGLECKADTSMKYAQLLDVLKAHRDIIVILPIKNNYGAASLPQPHRKKADGRLF